jgi:ribosomal protein S18 acetylase RimI-like enzyme
VKDTYVVRQVREIYAMVDVIQADHTDRVFVTSVWVVPNKRGRHYGSIALERVCRDADRECKVLVLQVDPDHDSPLQEDALSAFYERHGFKPYPDSWSTMSRSPQEITSKSKVFA